MIKRVVSFALHQPLFVALMAILFIGGGVAAFIHLPIEAFPDVSDIQVNVITLFPGTHRKKSRSRSRFPLKSSSTASAFSADVLAHAVRIVLHHADVR